jgi:hypothetical protein
VVAFAKNYSKEPGGAALEVESVCGASAVTSALARSPLKLLTPRARGRSVWACTSSFGSTSASAKTRAVFSARRLPQKFIAIPINFRAAT